MVDFFSRENNEAALDWDIESRGASRRDSFASGNQQDTRLMNSPRIPLEMLDRLATTEHPEFMKTVGTNLMLDSFYLNKITDDRPLFTATMTALRHHDLIVALQINEDAVARFLVQVEDGYEYQCLHGATRFTIYLLCFSC